MQKRALVRALRATLLSWGLFSVGGASADAPTIYTRADLERGGYSSLGDVLQRLPYAGGTLSPRYNSGGDGSHLIDLRDLGASRTVMLVDGQRWSETLQGTTDLAGIPLSAVERVELYRYSAPADMPGGIAGTVNIVLRTGLHGAHAHAGFSEFEQGDGRTQQYDVSLGSVGVRGAVMLQASYTQQDAIANGDRAISAVPLFGFDGNNVATGASSTTPFGRFGVVGTPGTVTLIPGRAGTSPADFRAFDLTRDGYNFAPDRYLLTPAERTGVFVSARYALSDSVRFDTQVLYNQRRSAQRFAPQPLVFGTVGSGAARLTVPANHVYNPFGREVTRAQFRNRLLPQHFEQDVDTLVYDASLEGRFDGFDRAWSWSTGYRYADREQAGANTGLFNMERLRLGLGPSFRDDDGATRCGTPGNIIAGCVPISIFGGPAGFTREMLDYATFVGHDRMRTASHDYHADIAGQVGELPAGPVGLVAGYRHRRVSGFDEPDALVASGATTGTARPAIDGAAHVNEAYIEFNLPLLRDTAAAHNLDATLGVRHVGHRNATFDEPSLAVYWGPTPHWSIRAQYIENSRAPSVSELFESTFGAFQEYFDVCDPANTLTGVLHDRCRNGFAGLAAVPQSYSQGITQHRVTAGGNPNLQPERGRTTRLGLRWTPVSEIALELHLDWYRTLLVDTIGPRYLGDIVDDCYINGNVDSCALIRREPFGGSLLDVFVGSQNLPGGTEVEGYDLDLGYTVDTELGRFGLRLQTVYTAYFGALDQPRRGNRVGVYDGVGQAHHRIKSSLIGHWQRDDWSGALTVRYLSSLDEPCVFPIVFDRPELCSDPGQPDPQFAQPFATGVNQLADTWYVDLEGGWDTPWAGHISLGVRNLFDRDPPVSYTTAANNFDPGYEVPGRVWFVGYQQRF